MTTKVTLYTGKSCSYCHSAIALLKNRQISFEEIDVSENPALRQKISDQTQWRTIPMIFIGEKFIGGFRELNELDQKGLLRESLDSK